MVIHQAEHRRDRSDSLNLHSASNESHVIHHFPVQTTSSEEWRKNFLHFSTVFFRETILIKPH